MPAFVLAFSVWLRSKDRLLTPANRGCLLPQAAGPGLSLETLLALPMDSRITGKGSL
jgi:hypothetical protein